MHLSAINTHHFPAKGQRVQGAPRLWTVWAETIHHLGGLHVHASRGLEWSSVVSPVFTHASLAGCIMNSFHNVAAAQKRDVFFAGSLTELLRRQRGLS